MIGLALIISVAAVIAAFAKKSPYKVLVIVLAALAAIVFLVTLHFTDQKDPANPFAVLGPALIGSLTTLIIALAALTTAFLPKR